MRKILTSSLMLNAEKPTHMLHIHIDYYYELVVCCL